MHVLRFVPAARPGRPRRRSPSPTSASPAETEHRLTPEIPPRRRAARRATKVHRGPRSWWGLRARPIPRSPRAALRADAGYAHHAGRVPPSPGDACAGGAKRPLEQVRAGASEGAAVGPASGAQESKASSAVARGGGAAGPPDADALFELEPGEYGAARAHPHEGELARLLGRSRRRPQRTGLRPSEAAERFDCVASSRARTPRRGAGAGAPPSRPPFVAVDGGHGRRAHWYHGCHAKGMNRQQAVRPRAPRSAPHTRPRYFAASDVIAAPRALSRD
jgi:hypothetical protein